MVVSCVTHENLPSAPLRKHSSLDRRRTWTLLGHASDLLLSVQRTRKAAVLLAAFLGVGYSALVCSLLVVESAGVALLVHPNHASAHISAPHLMADNALATFQLCFLQLHCCPEMQLSSEQNTEVAGGKQWPHAPGTAGSVTQL